MSFLGRLFGGKPKVLQHPVFGRLERDLDCSWAASGLSFWGVDGVQLVVMDLDGDGPTKAQEAAFSRLLGDASLLSRCLPLLAAKRDEVRGAAGDFTLVGVCLASAGGTSDAPTLIFRVAADQRFAYHVAVEDDGRKLTASADDETAPLE